MFDKSVTPHDCNEEVSFPSLSSLIDACGEEFDCLRVTVGDNPTAKYKAFADTKNGYVISDGNTTEEAIARLWLVLNK